MPSAYAHGDSRGDKQASNVVSGETAQNRATTKAQNTEQGGSSRSKQANEAGIDDCED